MSLPKTKHFVVLLILSLALRLYMSVQIYSGDLNNHFKWGESIIDVGSSGAYDRFYPTVMQPTYPPLALYAFTTSSLAFRWVYSAAWYLNSHVSIFPSSIIWALQDQDVMPAFQKIIAIISDLGIGVLLYTFSRRLRPQSPNLALLVSSLYLLNPAVWYVSSIWGQIDSFPLFFILLSFYLIYRKQSLLSVLAFTAALLSKQSSIIFAPVFAVYFFSRFQFKNIFPVLASSLVLFYLSYLPFSSSSSILWPVQIYLNRLQTGSGSDYITDHAFNFWALFTQLQKISDSRIAILSFSYSQLGYLIFVLISIPFIIIFLRHPKTWQLFNVGTIISLSAFLFLPRMHERYLVPALPLILLASIFSPNLLYLYVLLSVGHLANLYHDWWFPRIPSLVTLLSTWSSIQIIIVAFLASLVLIVANQFKKYEK